MLEKQLTFTKLVINLMVVHMLSQSTSVILGYGTGCALVVGLMEAFATLILTLVQSRLVLFL